MPSPCCPEGMGADNGDDLGVSYNAKLCENNESASSACDWRSFDVLRYENCSQLIEDLARAAARCKFALIRWKSVASLTTVGDCKRTRRYDSASAIRLGRDDRRNMTSCQ